MVIKIGHEQRFCHVSDCGLNALCNRMSDVTIVFMNRLLTVNGQSLAIGRHRRSRSGSNPP